MKGKHVRNGILALFSILLLAAAWLAIAGPPVPNCQRLCQRVYDLCIADGWQPAECEIKRQMCLDDCFGS